MAAYTKLHSFFLVNSYLKKYLHVFVNLTFNCSNPSFNYAMKPIYYVLRLEKFVLMFLLTKSYCSFHGKFIA